MSDDLSEIELLSTADPMVWAKAFVRTLENFPDTADPHDEGFMVAWFANAMQAKEMSGK